MATSLECTAPCKPFSLTIMKDIDRNLKMAANDFEFLATIRGYHVYRDVWHPEEDEILSCSHEVGNAFDVFAIKATNQRGIIVGHLSREIPRPSKFLLDRGASIKAILVGTNYRRSPLFQGGLEIPCLVKVRMPGPYGPPLKSWNATVK